MIQKNNLKKNYVAGCLPDAMYDDFMAKSMVIDSGKSGLIREMIRFYLKNNPVTDEERSAYDVYKINQPANEPNL